MGAWEWGTYGTVLRAEPGSRMAYAYLAFKVELIRNGFGENIVLSPNWGDAVKNRTREFQKSRRLTETGLVNFSTAKELFRKLVEDTEQKYDLPAGALGKKLQLESGWDPVAIGTRDPADTGIAQINIGIHSTVSREDAFDPGFAVPWAARYIRSEFDEIARDIEVMKAARAAYNIGSFRASMWLLAGFPAEGLVIDGLDWFKRATDYIAAIDRQSW